MQEQTWMGREGDPLGIVQKTEIDFTNKCYINKLEAVLENEMLKILYEIQMDYLIQAKRPKTVLTKKKKKESTIKWVLLCQQMTKWKARQIPKPWKRTEKSVKHEDNIDTNHSWDPWNSPQKPGKRFKEMERRKRIETNQTTALLKSTWILWRVLEIWGNLLSLRLQ